MLDSQELLGCHLQSSWVLTEVPRVVHCGFTISSRTSCEGDMTPWNQLLQRSWQKLTRFLLQKQVLPAEVVCAHGEKWLWGSGYKRGTLWGHTEVSAGPRGGNKWWVWGGAPELSLDVSLTMKMVGKRSQVKTTAASKLSLLQTPRAPQCTPWSPPGLRHSGWGGHMWYYVRGFAMTTVINTI